MHKYLHGLVCQRCGTVYPLNFPGLRCGCGGNLIEQTLLFSREMSIPQKWEKAVRNHTFGQDDHCLDRTLEFK
ncbi:MAG: hypothetical protein ABIB55_01380 [Candidatus Nealsonbacteria bacterium]